MNEYLRTLADQGGTVRGVSETVGLTPLLYTWQPLVERGRQTNLLPAIRVGTINTTVVYRHWLGRRFANVVAIYLLGRYVQNEETSKSLPDDKW
jgi:hypothetical protein